MPQKSAGILLYRWHNNYLEVLLVHPGGPLWAKKDKGAWSIPKGLVDRGEQPQETAKREFLEETGHRIEDRLLALTPIKQKGGKVVQAYAVQGDLDPRNVSSNFFTMEWPPRSGQKQQFPEIDQADWFDLETAKLKIIPNQLPLLEEIRLLLTRVNRQ